MAAAAVGESMFQRQANKVNVDSGLFAYTVWKGWKCIKEGVLTPSSSPDVYELGVMI